MSGLAKQKLCAGVQQDRGQDHPGLARLAHVYQERLSFRFPFVTNWFENISNDVELSFVCSH